MMQRQICGVWAQLSTSASQGRLHSKPLRRTNSKPSMKIVSTFSPSKELHYNRLASYQINYLLNQMHSLSSVPTYLPTDKKNIYHKLQLKFKFAQKSIFLTNIFSYCLLLLLADKKTKRRFLWSTFFVNFLQQFIGSNVASKVSPNRMNLNQYVIPVYVAAPELKFIAISTLISV